MKGQHHNHSHVHSHAHATGNIATAFALNTVFALIELVGGLLTNSVAILSDAVHDLGDSLSLGTAWYFEKKSKKGRSKLFNYGYYRFSLMGAFINCIVLVIGSLFVIQESIKRLSNPEQANAKGMLLIAILGIVVNAVAMMRLKRGSSINERVVSLHFLEDVLGWVAVLIGSVIMIFVDIPILDPILSLLIAGFVLFNVYRNIKPAFNIVLQGVPKDISESEVCELLMKDPEVKEIHDFRFWTLDGAHHVASMHIVVRSNLDLKKAEFLKEGIKKQLKKIHIIDATIEVEYDPHHE